jgi:hypothetical protein
VRAQSFFTALRNSLAGNQEDRSQPANTLAPPVARKRDVKQFRQACREVGLTARERYEASETLHAEKQGSGKKEHMSYEQLLAWLREWKQR